jgi:anti-anti-sigma factor
MADIPRLTRPAVIALPAEIDMANAHRVGVEFETAFASGAAVVVADMTATTFCDSMGIRALMLAHQRAAANGGELRVVVPSAAIVRVLAITGVDKVLRIYPNLDAALR